MLRYSELTFAGRLLEVQVCSQLPRHAGVWMSAPGVERVWRPPALETPRPGAAGRAAGGRGREVEGKPGRAPGSQGKGVG